MNKVNVLVTGADGFIGSHLVEMLYSKRYQVRALSQYNSFNNWGWLEGINCKDKTKLLSNKLIKNKILRFIKEENRKNIMSDRYIVFKLKKNGINIARRTVSKYRKLMNIPSSFKRKKKLTKYF